MTLFGSIRARLATLIRSERGMALPTALFAMIASMGLASAAILASVNVQQGSTRDSGAKKSIAAADAGAAVALLRLNRFIKTLSPTTPCLGPNGEPQAETSPGSGWCPATPAAKVGDATYSYMVSAFQGGTKLSVVSVGTDDGVSRRVKVGLSTTEAEPVFATEKLVLQSDVLVKGNVEIESDLGTNGGIENDGGSYSICGDVRHGKGKAGNELHLDCEGKVTEGEKQLPEVQPPPDIATNNSNCRLSWTCPISTEKDTYGGSGKPNWNPTTRTLEVDGNSSLSLGGSKPYFICALLIKSGQVIMPSGANVTIYFDTPENCGMSAGAVRMDIGGQGELISSGYGPEHGRFEVPSLYFLGSKTIPTEIHLKGTAGTKNEFILYAPYVHTNMEGTAEWKGMIAGYDLEIHGTPKITTDPNIKGPNIEYERLFSRERYFECTGATASPPDADC